MCHFSIPTDTNGHFKFDWDSNIVYELVYRDSKKKINKDITFSIYFIYLFLVSLNRSCSPSPSSNQSGMWNWLKVIGSKSIYVFCLLKNLKIFSVKSINVNLFISFSIDHRFFQNYKFYY